MVVYHINPTTREKEAVDLYEFEGSMVHIESSGLFGATQRDPVSKLTN